MVTAKRNKVALYRAYNRLQGIGQRIQAGNGRGSRGKLNVTRCYKTIGTCYNKDPGEKAKPCRIAGPAMQDTMNRYCKITCPALQDRCTARPPAIAL